MKFAALMLLCCAVPAMAQLGGGTILGTVTDSSGAPAANAEVVITNLSTNVPYTTRTTSEGFYTTPALAIGAYRVTVEAPGFRKAIRTGITLQIDQKARVDVRLELGALSQSVEVVGDAAMVDTASATSGKVVGEREIEDLPLNGRNAFSMLALTPGVNNNANPVNAGFGSRGYEVANVNINGGVNGFNSFNIDGGNNNNTVLNEVNANPSVDTIKEFKVQSNTMSAEYGFTLGGVVNVATKSGTNRFFGTLSEYLRNDALDARNAFAFSRPILRYNQFGGTLGGPVTIPKLYSGRNRTFFFFNYEGYRRRGQNVAFNTLPTLREREGDFSQLRTANGVPIPIYDPSTTLANPGGAGFIRDPFPGNTIPRSRLDPVALNSMSYVALPNTTPINAFTQQNNFYNVTGTGLQSDQWALRIDQRLTDRNQMYVRYMDFWHRPRPVQGGMVPWELNGRDDRYKTRNFIVSDTHTISPNVISEFRLSLARQHFLYTAPSAGQDWPKKLGLPDSFPQYVVPSWRIGSSDAQFSGASPGTFRAGLTTQIFEAITFVMGRHTLKVGGEVRRNQANTGNFVPCDSGSWGFDQTLTGNPQNSGGTGSSTATFLLGAVRTNGSYGCTGNQTIRNYSVSPFIQEDWKATRRLNLNIGLRYDYQQPAHEAHGRSSNFDLNAINPLTGLPGMMIYGSADQALPPLTRDKLNFSPRFGFAYDVFGDGRTSFRGGYSIFYASVHNFAPGGDGFARNTVNFQSPANNANFAAWYLKNGLPPHNLPLPVGAALGPNNNLANGVSMYQGGQRTPSSQQWSASLQRQVGKDWVFELMYSANHGTHLLALGYDANQIPPEIRLMGLALDDLVPNPYAGRMPGNLGAATTRRINLYRPYPWLSTVNVLAPQMGNSIYHSGLVSARKRMSHGFSLLASYTWAKMINDSSTSNIDYSSEQASSAATSQNGLYDRRADRSLAPQDVRHRAVGSAIYELPVGRGKLWNPKNNIVRMAAVGWQLNGIFTVQTGQPVIINCSANCNSARRPNSTGNSAFLPERNAIRWFDTDAFVNPPVNQLGNLARTLPDVARPGLVNMDLSAMKHFRLTERSKLQLRWETFNTLNHVNLNGPNTSFDPGPVNVSTTGRNISALFGRITSARGARSMQIALRIIF